MLEAWQLQTQPRGLGQWEILDALPGLVNAGVGVYNATQQQQSVAAALQQQAAQFQAQLLQQQQQQAQVAAQQQAAAQAAESPFGGIPLWGLALGAVLGLALVFGARRGRR